MLTGKVSRRKEGQMKTDEQYVMEFETLFEKHLTWNTQRVMDMFKAEHGSLNEDDVLRLFNKWITRKRIPSLINAKTVSRHLGAFHVLDPPRSYTTSRF
jgi:hypothetical protein